MNDGPKRLYLNRQDKKLTGLCAGIADYFNVDPTLVRLSTIALAIVTGGAGILAYLVGALVVPAKPIDPKK